MFKYPNQQDHFGSFSWPSLPTTINQNTQLLWSVYLLNLKINKCVVWYFYWSSLIKYKLTRYWQFLAKVNYDYAPSETEGGGRRLFPSSQFQLASIPLQRDIHYVLDSTVSKEVQTLWKPQHPSGQNESQPLCQMAMQGPVWNNFASMLN